MFFDLLQTPIGTLFVAGDNQGIARVAFDTESSIEEAGKFGWKHGPEHFDELVCQLNDYFSGRLRLFTIKLNPQGTFFQLQVWNAVRSIPYGSVLSYSALASRLGRPSSTRAVGHANAANPLPILIPCHRLVGADGELVGYIGGLDRKSSLLELERNAHVSPTVRVQP